MRTILITMVCVLLTTLGGNAFADDLQWDDPAADWTNITGYTFYFSTPGQEPYNRTVALTELIRANGFVTYTDFVNKFNLAFDIPYSIYVTAYNSAGQTGPSNTIVYTRAGYVPPQNRLPDTVVSSAQSPVGLGVK